MYIYYKKYTSYKNWSSYTQEQKYSQIYTYICTHVPCLTCYTVFKDLLIKTHFQESMQNNSHGVQLNLSETSYKCIKR